MKDDLFLSVILILPGLYLLISFFKHKHKYKTDPTLMNLRAIFWGLLGLILGITLLITTLLDA